MKLLAICIVIGVCTDTYVIYQGFFKIYKLFTCCLHQLPTSH